MCLINKNNRSPSLEVLDIAVLELWSIIWWSGTKSPLPVSYRIKHLRWKLSQQLVGLPHIYIYTHHRPWQYLIMKLCHWTESIPSLIKGLLKLRSCLIIPIYMYMYVYLLPSLYSGSRWITPMNKAYCEIQLNIPFLAIIHLINFDQCSLPLTVTISWREFQ